MHEMLNVGGILYTYFSPIWIAANGSHGFHPKELNILGDHCHLLFNYSSLQEFLVKKYNYSPYKALESAERLYRLPQINRYSFEDYISIFRSSDFSEKDFLMAENTTSFKEIYTPEVLKRINKYYPTMQTSCLGFELIFVK